MAHKDPRKVQRDRDRRDRKKAGHKKIKEPKRPRKVTLIHRIQAPKGQLKENSHQSRCLVTNFLFCKGLALLYSPIYHFFKIKS